MNYLLIGRPNVGKSSIFNVLTAFNNNIVHSEEGTTRDWHQELIKGLKSYVFDTPGILIKENNKKDFLKLSFNIISDNKIDIFLYVIDYNSGFNSLDNFSINKLRGYGKKIILIINKYDNHNLEPNIEFNKYKIPDTVYISCSHSYGIEKLKLFLKENELKVSHIADDDFSFAIFGKPNVGKSTFLNSIMGYKRSITSSIAGTTSDFVVDYINYKKKRIKIIDTAGIRKKSNIKNKSLNFYSTKKTFENIIKVDVAIILIDSKEGLDRQDKRIIKLVSDKSKSIIIIFNKFDLILDKKNYKLQIKSEIDNTLGEIKNIKFFFISALNKNHVSKILEYLYINLFLNDFKITTSKLNQWLKNAIIKNQHPLIENKSINFKYAVQIKERPITIKVFCNYSSKLKNNYKKYLVNNFNHNFKILNQKTKFIFSSSKNPYL